MPAGTVDATIIHASGVYSLKVLKDTDYIVSGAWDTTLKVWNPSTQAEVASLTSGHTAFVSALDLLEDDNLASGSVDNKVVLWNVTNNALYRTMIDTNTPNDNIYSVGTLIRCKNYNIH